MTRLNKLAEGFVPRTEEDWRKAASEGLGDRPFDSLSGRSDEGIAIGPIYRSASDAPPIAGRAAGAPWRIIQRIDDPDPAAARLAIAAEIDGGADGVEIVLAGSASARGRGMAAGEESAARLLGQTERGVSPIREIRIDGGEASAEFGRAVRASAGGRGPQIGSLTLAFDPIATLAATGSLTRPLESVVGESVGTAPELGENDRAVIADGRPWHNGGASATQELGAVIAAFVAYLRAFDAADVAPGAAAGRIGMALAADSDQFLTMAKFRALRLLHARVLEVAGVSRRPAHLHAETSWRMLSRRDRQVNILRSTAAAFAAGTGGADSVTTLAFDTPFGTADAHARRTARNSQLVLIEEAGLAHVADPGAGAGAVEALTEALAETAWEEFRAIEAEGGLAAAVRSGTLQRAIAATAAARFERVRRLALPLTGTSVFPAAGEPPTGAAEVLRKASGTARGETADTLVAARLAEPFEALRERADGLKAPAVFLACIGRRTEFAEAATAAANFFGVAGLGTTEHAVGDGGHLVQAFAAARTPLACLCAGAKGLEAAVAAAQTLKAAGARQVYFIGAPGEAGARLAAAGIDHVIADGIDAVRLLDGALKAAAEERHA